VSDGPLRQDGQPFDAFMELSWSSLVAYDTAWCTPQAERFRQVLQDDTDLARSAGIVADPFRVIWR
jgi:hypothetical protein